MPFAFFFFISMPLLNDMTMFRNMRRDDYLAVSSINMIGMYSNTQLRTIYIDIHIVDIDKGKAM